MPGMTVAAFTSMAPTATYWRSVSGCTAAAAPHAKSPHPLVASVIEANEQEPG